MRDMKRRILLVGGEAARSPHLLELPPDWDLRTASSAAAAQPLLDRALDAVVADEALPDGDGFAFLENAQARVPEAHRLVIADLGNAHSAVKSMRAGHQLIPKPWDPQLIVEALDRAFSIGLWLGKPALRSSMDRMRVVPSPPDLYFAVVRALNSPERDLDEVSAKAAQDPAMTAKLLQVANSAALGLRHQVASVSEAIHFLGLQTTRSLILLAHTFSYCDRKMGGGFRIERLWQHSLRAGGFARRIAQLESSSPKLADEAFLAGLLHDLGELLLAVNMPAEFDRAANLAREAEASGARTPFWRVQAEFIGVSHAEIGAELMARWNLPLPVVEAIALHHRPAPMLSQKFSPLTAVHAADVLANDLEPSHDSLDHTVMDGDYLAHLGLADRLPAWREACEVEFSSDSDL
jgi:HD-like signal output (HDOD) protein